MDRKLIIDLYLSGKSLSKVAAEAKVSRQTIYQHLKKAGITLRSSAEAVRRLSNTDEQDVINLYHNGISQHELANKYDVNVSVISNTMKKYGIAIRGVRESVNYTNVYLPRPSDGNIFYYWLGWMLTDGWIYSRKYSIIAGLGSTDRHIIEFFRDKFSPSRAIYEAMTKTRTGNDSKKFYRLLMPITNDDVNFYSEWGLISRKSKILKPTNDLFNLSNDNFIQLFVGMIEGDGSIYRNRDGKLFIKYYGTKEMCEYVINKIGFGKMNKSRTIYAAVWTHDKASQLADKFNVAEFMLLRRKWDKIDVSI